MSAFQPSSDESREIRFSSLPRHPQPVRFLTRPSLVHYTLDRAELLQRANDIFKWTAAGELKVRIDKAFPLAEAAEAHRQLEGRKTTGKLLLLP